MKIINYNINEFYTEALEKGTKLIYIGYLSTYTQVVCRLSEEELEKHCFTPFGAICAAAAFSDFEAVFEQRGGLRKGVPPSSPREISPPPRKLES